MCRWYIKISITSAGHVNFKGGVDYDARLRRIMLSRNMKQQEDKGLVKDTNSSSILEPRSRSSLLENNALAAFD